MKYLAWWYVHLSISFCSSSPDICRTKLSIHYLIASLSIRSSICVYPSTAIYPSIHSSINLSVHLSIRTLILDPYVHPSIHISSQPSAHQSNHPFSQSSIYPPIQLSIHPIIHPSIHVPSCQLIYLIICQGGYYFVPVSKNYEWFGTKSGSRMIDASPKMNFTILCALWRADADVLTKLVS